MIRIWRGVQRRFKRLLSYGIWVVPLFLYLRWYATDSVSAIAGLLQFLQFALNLAMAMFFMIIQFVALFYFLGRTHSYWIKPGETGVTFKDYRGNPEVLEQAKRIVTLLKGAKKFKQMGGQVSRGILLVGSPGTGKCVSGDTLVVTSRGIHRIDTYADAAQAPDSFRVVNVEVVTHLGTTQASHFYYGGEQSVMRLTTRRGYSLTATPEHPILSITSDGELAFRPVSTLRSGDYVAIWRGNGDFGGNDDLRSYVGDPSQYLPVRVPLVADEEFGYFLGLTVGDGCTRDSKSSMLFYKPNSDVTHAWESFVVHRLGLPVHRVRGKSGGHALSVYSERTRVKQWLGALGFDPNAYSKDRTVPRVILEGSASVVRGFLRGLFDTDGRFGTNKGAPFVWYTTASAELARQVHLLLLKFGIVSRLAAYKAVSKGRLETQYRVMMSGQDARLFFKHISTRRQDIIQEVNYITNGRYRTTTFDVLPYASSHLRRLYRRGLFNGSEIRENWQYITGIARPSREKLRRILELLALRDPLLVNHPSYLYLMYIAECQYYFDQVKSVTPAGVAHVYDFTVPLSHSFITNGLISHNSYLAQAMANECEVPFAYMSAASLTSMFWGVGNLKVFSLYRKARKMAMEYGACIIFMDEFDAIGTSRMRQGGAGFPLFGGANTLLNELLLQMDPPRVETRWWAKLLRVLGFRPKPGPQPLVITMAATNIEEALDPALLRPGRFDRKIAVGPPDFEGRKDVIQYYLSKVRHVPELESPSMLDRLSHDMIGATPAVIQHVINEAVIKAHFDGRNEVTYEDISYALDTHQWGLKQPIRGQSEDERRMIAYHEAGHAIAQVLLLPHNRLYKVTIIRHERALGMSASRPKEERRIRTKDEILAEIQVCLASGASEELFLHNRSTGMSTDIQYATSWAKAYVGTWGLGDEFTDMNQLELSDEQKDEIRKVLREQYQNVKQLLAAHSEAVHKLVDRLLEKNEVFGDEVERIVDECKKSIMNIEPSGESLSNVVEVK